MQTEYTKGETCGKLTCLEPYVERPRPGDWRGLWQCACGTVKLMRNSSIRRGAIVSCGCSRKEVRGINQTHGKSRYGNRTYKSWASMKYRCDNPNSNRYEEYGARGITYCERWAVFENFLEDMGERPEGKTLDRIGDAKLYCKENCRWADPKTQANNRRPRRWGKKPKETP